MRTLSVFGLALILGIGLAGAQELANAQKQAVDRQERNQKEAAKKLKDMLDGYAKDMAVLSGPDVLIRPGFFKGYMVKGDEVVSKCDAIQSDLDKSKCPADHPRVKALTDWIAETRATVDKLKAEMQPKLAEMEKLADPKNYPNLDADFEQMATLTNAYGIKSFKSHPDKVAELAKEFPQVVTWAKEKFKEYRPILVLTGGKESPLYKRYDALSGAIKGFQEEAGKFFEQAAKDVPGLLKKAEEMATKAAADKKPAFFTGGVRQQFDQAEEYLKVCRGLAPADHPGLVAMETAFTDTRKRVDEAAASLKEEIVASTMPPTEKYKGADKEDLRGQILAAWKEAWPDDEVLTIKFHMENFDRRQKAIWDAGSKAWNFDDRSVLCVTVIVKTSDTIATTHPAYVNVDHISNATTFGVQTKGSAYVSEEMLVANVK